MSQTQRAMARALRLSLAGWHSFPPLAPRMLRGRAADDARAMPPPTPTPAAGSAGLLGVAARLGRRLVGARPAAAGPEAAAALPAGRGGTLRAGPAALARWAALHAAGPGGAPLGVALGAALAPSAAAARLPALRARSAAAEWSAAAGHRAAWPQAGVARPGAAGLRPVAGWAAPATRPDLPSVAPAAAGRGRGTAGVGSWPAAAWGATGFAAAPTPGAAFAPSGTFQAAGTFPAAGTSAGGTSPGGTSPGGPAEGDVYLDGERMGRWMARQLSRALDRPRDGGTGFDPALSPRWPGTLGGG